MKLSMILIMIFCMFILSTVTITSTHYDDINKIDMDHINDDNSASLLDPYLEYANVIAYLYMEDIVSDVIMKSGNDNKKYLNTNKDKKYAFHGELFFSQESKVTHVSDDFDMKRIYGHKMLNGSKFGYLIFLLEPDNKRPLYLYTETGVKEFELTRAFRYEDGTESFETALETGISKNEYLEMVTQDAIVSHVDEYDVEVKNILFLQTCENASSDIRYVFVFAEVSHE